MQNMTFVRMLQIETSSAFSIMKLSCQLLPALRSFCIFCALGIFFVYLLQATYFLAWMTLDQVSLSRKQVQRQKVMRRKEKRKYAIKNAVKTSKLASSNFVPSTSPPLIWALFSLQRRIEARRNGMLPCIKHHQTRYATLSDMALKNEEVSLASLSFSQPIFSDVQ